MKDKPIELNINHKKLTDIETEYTVTPEELNRALSEPEKVELLYLIQDIPKD